MNARVDRGVPLICTHFLVLMGFVSLVSAQTSTAPALASAETNAVSSSGFHSDECRLAVGFSSNERCVAVNLWTANGCFHVRSNAGDVHVSGNRCSFYFRRDFGSFSSINTDNQPALTGDDRITDISGYNCYFHLRSGVGHRHVNLPGRTPARGGRDRARRITSWVLPNPHRKARRARRNWKTARFCAAAKSLKLFPASSSPSMPAAGRRTSISCAASIWITARISRCSSTTCHSTCRRMRTAKVIPT